MSDWKNKVVVITGSSAGIGRELATQLLARGACVVLNGRTEASAARVEKLRLEYPTTATFFAADQRRAGEMQALMDYAANYFGQVDAVVANAGMSAYGDLRHSSSEVIHEIVESNFSGVLHLSRAAIPHLEKTKGSLLLISSLAGLHGLGGYSLYSGVKMALTAVAQSLRKELARSGVHVGIAYVSFTANDAEKRTLSPTGELENVPVRKGLPVLTQNQTAAKLRRQIERRKFSAVHTPFGALTHALSKWAPGLLHKVLLRAYERQASR